MIDIGARIAEIRAELGHLAYENEKQSALPRIIAVSKKQPEAQIRQAIAAGQRDFGESYLQEAVAKITALEADDLCWHFIGPVQSNKCRDIAAHFDWVHSVDRFKIAKRLAALRPATRPPLNILLQVNVDGDLKKSGIPPDQVLDLARQLESLRNLRLRGLMTILREGTSERQQRDSFNVMRGLFSSTRDSLGAPEHFSELSMGMSSDWRLAVSAGASMLRIGTAIFGSRQA